MKTGFLSQDIKSLSTVKTDLPNLPLVVLDKKCWFLGTDNTLNSSLREVVGNNKNFIQIPYNVSYPNQTKENVIIGSNVVDFSLYPRFLKITLDQNRQLNLINIPTYNSVYIILDLNGYLISNFLDIVKFPNNFDYTVFINKYSLLIIELIDVKNFLAGVVHLSIPDETYALYQDPPKNTIDIEGVIDGQDSNNNVSVSVFTGVTFNTFGINLNSSNIVYSKNNNNLDLTTTDYSIEFSIAFNDLSAYGSILSMWNDLSQDFWFYVSEGFLHVRIHTANDLDISFDISNLTTALFYHVKLDRVKNVFKLFFDGQLVGHSQDTSTIQNQAPLIIGKLNNAVSYGIAAATSFDGYIRDISISTTLVNNYKFIPKSPGLSFNPLITYNFKLGELEQVSQIVRSYTSDTTVENFLIEGDYFRSTTVLNEYTHFQIEGTDVFTESTDTLTIECWLKNTNGNARGTIIYYGDGTNTNFHLGIYDSKLQLNVNNTEVILTSTNDIPYDTWVHVAAVRNSNNEYRLYVNGVLEGITTNVQGLFQYGLDNPLCIKRSPLQDNTIPSTNISLYPSKSRLFISGIRIFSDEVYTGNSTTTHNFPISRFFD